MNQLSSAVSRMEFKYGCAMTLLGHIVNSLDAATKDMANGEHKDHESVKELRNLIVNWKARYDAIVASDRPRRSH